MPGCKLVKSAWLMECFWSMTLRDATPFLMHKVAPGEVRKNYAQTMQNVLKESNFENTSDGSSNDSADEDFMAEFENELMDMK